MNSNLEVPINTILKGTPRRCAVLSHFQNVQSVHLKEISLPRSSFIRTIQNPIQPNLPIAQPTPAEIIVEMQPSGMQQLQGTNDTSNSSNFVCSQVVASDTHVFYKTLNSELVYDTPLNFLSNLQFKIHSEQERLKKDPFEPQNSQDAFRIMAVGYMLNTRTTQFTLQNTPRQWSVGDAVSFRDISILTPIASMNTAQRVWYNTLLSMYQQNVIIVDIDIDNNTVTIHNELLNIDDEKWPDSDVSLDTDPEASILLNESMQYSLLLQFNCVEMRLVHKPKEYISNK